jgi:hypothetical protein
MMNQSRYAVCIDRSLDDCEALKVYRILKDSQSESEGLLRVVDDSGEEYLHPASSFLPLSLEKQQLDALEAMLAAAS